MRILVVLTAAAMAGCSIGMLPPGEDIAGPPPPYRKLVTAGLPAIVGDPSKAGKLQISPLRRVESVKGPAWLVCVAANPSGRATPLRYAVFIQNEKIFESRLAIQADRCDEQSYEPMKAK